MTSVPPPGYEQRGPWGFEDPEPPRDPARRLLQLAGALSVLLIALVAIAYLHGSSETSLNPIAEAAERTEEMPGARMTFSALYTSPGSSLGFVMRGEGVVNGRTQRSRVEGSMTVGDRRIRVEVIADRHTMFIRTSAPDADLPDGKEWVSIEPFLGHDPEAALAGRGDARQQLQLLRGAGGDVEEVGEEIVDGVPTTQYRGRVDLNRVVSILREEGKTELAQVMERLVRAESTGSIPVEVWVDDEGLVRRMRQIQTMSTKPGRPTMRMDMQIGFHDFGIEPAIRIPPARKVFDATPLVQAELGLTGKRKQRSRKAGSPLSPTAFRARVGNECSDMKHDFTALERKGEAMSAKVGQLAKWEGLKSPRTQRAMQEMAVEVLDPMVRVAERFLQRFERLQPPRSLWREYRRYLHLNEVQLDLVRALARAFEIAEFRLIDRLDDELDAHEDELKRLATALGASVCEQDDD